MLLHTKKQFVQLFTINEFFFYYECLIQNSNAPFIRVMFFFVVSCHKENELRVSPSPNQNVVVFFFLLYD